MKTLKITRSIKRRLPGNWFVWVRPDGLYFRQRRQTKVFFVSWTETIEKAQCLYAVNEFNSTFGRFDPFTPNDPEQVPMFPSLGEPSNQPVCRHCEEPLYDEAGKHVHYGNDLDNPVKHEFEPSGGTK